MEHGKNAAYYVEDYIIVNKNHIKKLWNINN